MISDLLIEWNEINKTKKEIVEREERIRNKIKIFLKENKWDKYNDETTNLSVTLKTEERKSFDETKLKLLLSDAQFNSVKKVTTFEVMRITNADDRERMKKFLKK